MGPARRWGLTDEARLVARYTRNWLHYGVIVFAVVCILMAVLRGAVER